jgi:hypothetical protein
MMRVTFRPPTPSDLDDLAARMREMDRKECELVAGLAPREALQQCVDGGEAATVAEVDGKVACIFGWTPASFLGADGYPWMLCADGIEKHARILLTCAPRFLGEMQGECERLSNVVHAHNRSAIRFLAWCGFSFGEMLEVKGEPFIHFEWRRQAAEAA